MKSVLITGGTGSFGRAYLKFILKKYKKLQRIVIFSRDEYKQSEMQKEFPLKKFPNIRFFIGDVRSKERIHRALDDIDCIVHAAAIKQVPTAEYNPFEYIQTNILGAQNIIEAALDRKIKKVVALSTDKASSPLNLYGATKLCSDKLFIAANNIKGKRDVSFSVVRYGNVFGSRGSVVPLFQQQMQEKFFTITDSKMTRFNISLDDGVKMVDWVINNSLGAEIFVPKIPSYKILDLARAFKNNPKFKFVGIRPGEKLHEEMISKSDSNNTYDIGKYYLILPNEFVLKNRSFLRKFKAKKVKFGFSYNSLDNNSFLKINELKKMIKKYTSNENN